MCDAGNEACAANTWGDDTHPTCERCGAVLTPEEVAQWRVDGEEYYRNCAACTTSQF